MVCVACVIVAQGHSGDGCVLASTLCKNDLRKGDLFVLGWTKVRRVSWENISSELLMGGDGVRSILLFPLVARCLKTIDVCIWRMFAFMSVVVNVCFVMQMVYVCVLCVSCGSSQCYILQDLQRMQEAIIWKRHTPEPVS